MNEDAAHEIARSVYSAGLDAAIEDLRTSLSNQAADPCHFALTKRRGEVGFHIMARLWEEYPDLRPPTLETEGGIDSVRFRVPREKLAPVREALARLRRASDDALPLVQSGASTPARSEATSSAAV